MHPTIEQLIQMINKLYHKCGAFPRLEIFRDCGA